MDQAKTTFRDARDRAGSSLTEGRRQAAEQIGGIGGALHRTGEQLRDEDQAPFADIADSVGRQVDRAADYLRESDGRTIARDIEGLARRQPAIVFAGAFALGLVAARFLKSSDPGAPRATSGSGPERGPAGDGGGSMHQLRQERSVGELFGQLTQDLSLLVRQETQLAKTEIQEKISRASRDLVSLAAGGVVALVGGFALTAAVILLLVDPIGLEPWLAALLVGALLAGGGYVMLRGGLRDLKRLDPAPRRTVESIKEDIQTREGAAAMNEYERHIEGATGSGDPQSRGRSPRRSSGRSKRPGSA